MKQEDKELLIKEISNRLSYNVKVQVLGWDEENGEVEVLLKVYSINTDGYLSFEYNHYNVETVYVEDCHLYLRPISSMTEEEMKELKTLCSIYIPTDSPIIGFEDYGIIVFTHHLTNNTYSFKLNVDVIDWLNKKMFDYRGLIEKGLAIEFF